MIFNARPNKNNYKTITTTTNLLVVVVVVVLPLVLFP